MMNYAESSPGSPSEFAEYPLSHGQRALWSLQQLASKGVAYNVAHAVRIRTELDVPALRRAFQKLVDRHPALRTTFAAPHREPIQRVYKHTEVCFRVEDASTWSEAYLNDRLAEEIYRPFDLERGPLMRVNIFSLSPQEYLLLLMMHHIVTDMWSLALIMYEVSQFYREEVTGEPPTLKPLRAQYTDYVRWQAEMLADPEGERLWAYWQKQLAGELPVLNLPTDRPRPPVQTDRGAAQSVRFSAELTQALKSLSKAHGATLYMTVLAAFQVLLHRYTGQEDILVGSPKAGRSRKVARMVGYFINPVVLRADLSGNLTFSTFLRHVRQTVLDAFEHDAYPFPLLVERLQPARDPSRSPLVQVMFSWQKTTRLVNSQRMTSFALGEKGGGMKLGGLQLEAVALEQRVTPFDLTLLMAEAGRELGAAVEYNVDLFDAATIRRMLGHLQTLLESIVANPDQRISTLPLLTESERRQLLIEWNDTAADYPQGQCVHQLFEAQVERTPDAVAVVYEGEQLTYRQLNQRANQLAHHLRKLGVGPEVLVGISVERSLEMVVGLLGILKAGGAYVPLDPTYPQERLAFMLEDSQVPVLLTQAHLVEQLPAPRITHHASRNTYHATRRVICLDSDWDFIAQESVENSISSVTPDNLAYVIYTSGSTGKPKGVMIPHRGLVNYLTWCQRAYPLEAGQGAPVHSSISFDLTITGLFVPLLVGRRVQLLPAALGVETLREALRNGTNFSLIKITPAHLELLSQQLSPSEAAGRTRAFIIGGENLLAESITFWQDFAPDTVLVNEYGPTETVVGCCVYQVPAGERKTGSVPIGRPIINTQLYILDTHLQPVPVGVPGELYIGGEGVARGYLNRPELTAERFIPDPFSGGVGARLYKTGDLVRYLPDGNIEFLGRTDHQVKIRGFRIEPGEIDAALGGHPALREVVVVAREDKSGNKRLVAYVVPEQEPAPTTSELRHFLKEKLPKYMVPSAFVTLETLPLTPSGKVDRRALPAPDGARPELEGDYVAPRTPVEEELVSIWAQLLGIERVGIYDNFFELGGHSLLATQLISRLREAFQVELPPHSLFEAATVADLAVVIAQHQAEQEDDAQMAQLLAELEQLSEDEVREMLADEILLQ